MTSNNNITTFKIVLVGDAKVGKTSLLYKLLYPDASLDSILNEFNKPDVNIKELDLPDNYCPTLGVSVHPVTFLTNYGVYCLNIWDCAGQEKYKGLNDGYFIQTQGAIIMRDNTTTTSFNKYKTDVFRVVECPYVLVTNKSDLMSPDLIPLGGHLISVLKSKNILEPFQDLLSQLTNKPDLVITQNVS